MNLWISILIFPFGTAMFLWIIGRYYKGLKTFNFLDNLALSTLSIIGLSIANDNYVETKNSGRLTVFVILICGSPFLYVYKSFLTSALAVPSIYKPFTSPEEILYTSYR